MILKLALSDLKCDRLMSVCAAAAMTAVIAPLLLLFSLRYGIITSLEDNLRNSPANLEIKMLSGYDLDEGFFSKMRSDKDVGFVIEVTRALSLTSDIMGKGRVRTMVDTVPTGKGDPLFAFSKIPDLKGDGECVLTSQLASDLGVAKGGSVKIAISRTMNGERQSAARTFQVAGVLKNAAAPGLHAYLTLPVITAMEDWRDGYEPAIFSDGSKPNVKRTTFSKARIYASSIDSLEGLSKKLRARFNISDRTSEVENIFTSHPEFCMEMPETSMDLYPESGTQRILDIKFTYFHSPEELAAMRDEVETSVRRIVSVYGLSNSELTNARRIYERLGRNAGYIPQEDSRTASDGVYGALINGQANSYGFAQAYCLLMQSCGIPCTIVSGQKGGAAHSWCLMDVDGTSCYVDPSLAADGDHMWFLLGTMELELNGYEIQNPEEYPFVELPWALRPSP